MILTLHARVSSPGRAPDHWKLIPPPPFDPDEDPDADPDEDPDAAPGLVDLVESTAGARLDLWYEMQKQINLAFADDVLSALTARGMGLKVSHQTSGANRLRPRVEERRDGLRCTRGG